MTENFKLSTLWMNGPHILTKKEIDNSGITIRSCESLLTTYEEIEEDEQVTAMKIVSNDNGHTRGIGQVINIQNFRTLRN